MHLLERSPVDALICALHLDSSEGEFSNWFSASFSSLGSGEPAESLTATSVAIDYATATATSLVVPDIGAHLEDAGGQETGVEIGAAAFTIDGDGLSPDAEFSVSATPSAAALQPLAANFPSGALPDIHLSAHERAAHPNPNPATASASASASASARPSGALAAAAAAGEALDAENNNHIIINNSSSNNSENHSTSSPMADVDAAADLYEASGPQRLSPSPQPTPSRYRKISVIVPTAHAATSTAAGTISKRRGVSVSAQPLGVTSELHPPPPPNSLAVGGDYLQASLSSLNSNASYTSTRSGSTSGKREQYVRHCTNAAHS